LICNAIYAGTSVEFIIRGDEPLGGYLAFSAWLALNLLVFYLWKTNWIQTKGAEYMSKDRLGIIIFWGVVAYFSYYSIFLDKGEELESFPNYLVGYWQETSIGSGGILRIAEKSVTFEGRFYETSSIEADMASDGLAGTYTVSIKGKCCEWLALSIDRNDILKVHEFWEAGENRYGDMRYQYTKKKSYSKRK